MWDWVPSDSMVKSSRSFYIFSQCYHPAVPGCPLLWLGACLPLSRAWLPETFPLERIENVLRALLYFLFSMYVRHLDITRRSSKDFSESF